MKDVRGTTTRRGFLAGSAALAAAATLPWPAAARGPTEVAWRGLAGKLGGRLLRPGDRAFTLGAMPFNLRYAGRLPGGIAVCRDAQDVATAVLWARENDVPLAIRGGGHSYAGFSTTEGLMISTAGLGGARIDAASGEATVGAGALNADLYAAFEAAGATITHGRCPTVGVAGFLLGGGIGFNMRLYGLGADRLVSTDLVTADGAVVTAGASENADLFWACRGGAGGNFGINTSFTVATVPAEPRVVFILKWPAPTPRLLAAVIAALDAAPPTVGSRLSLDQVPGEEAPTLNLIGQIAGSREEMLDILAPAFAVAAPVEPEITAYGYWNAQKALLDGDGPFPFAERSRFVTDPLGEDFAAAALGWMASWPGLGEGADLVLFQTGGRMNEVAAGATAFAHRDSRWLAVSAVTWSEDDTDDTVGRLVDWQAGVYAELTTFARGGAYQNFPDPELDDWAEAYYGANLARLREVKRRVDPDNVFRFAQSIPPA